MVFILKYYNLGTHSFVSVLSIYEILPWMTIRSLIPYRLCEFHSSTSPLERAIPQVMVTQCAILRRPSHPAPG